MAPDAGNRLFIAQEICSTSSPGYPMRCSMSRKPNGSMQLSLDQMRRNGRI